MPTSHPMGSPSVAPSHGRTKLRVLAGLTTVGMAVAIIVAACTPNGDRASVAKPVRFTDAPGDTLKEPIVIRSVPTQVNGQTIGILDVTLQVVMDTTAVAGYQGPMQMRAYKLVKANGQTYNNVGFPGPTFRIHPGDSVRINLVNNLPADPSPHACVNYAATDTTPPRDTFPNCFHGPNTTNIHYHGFHVTPDSSGDNVLVEVAPGSSHQSAFRVPMNQSPGTMWYHPHKHGSVALQVTNGMSGAFIVDGGGLDSVTQSLHMTEHLIGVQQVDSQVNLVSPTKSGSGVKLVNAQINPVIVMQAGEVQRWRVVNENVSATTTYALVFESDTGSAPKMFDIARDGIQYDPANYDAVHPDTSLIVAPGNRLDVFVKAPTTPGLHKLNARLLGRIGPRRALLLGAAGKAAAQPLLTVRVVPRTGNVDTILPATLPALPAFLANLPATKDTAQSLYFSENGNPGGGGNPPSFFLGTTTKPLQKFNPDSNFMLLPLNQVQTWKINNASVNANHPFHIHINPFQVIKVVYDSGDANAPLYAQMNAASAAGHPIWMDTFALPLGTAQGTAPNKPSYAIIRQKYADFTGSFVMHCHILGHEERGMMQKLTVIGGAAPAVADTKAKGGK